MTCRACWSRVEKKFSKLDGVLEATVNLTTERARVAYVPGLVYQARLFEAVEKAGYTAVALDDEKPIRMTNRPARPTGSRKR